jgi:L-threonylcarbamoyladenylate synthase
MEKESPTPALPAFLSASPEDVARAAALLRAGEVVALPTETVYGLAANALDEAAVRRVFAIKGRPLLDPLIVHGLDGEFLERVAEFTPAARRLAAACWPGPLTLVVPKRAVVPDVVTAGRATVAVRAPAHPVMRAVLAACGLPLAAPSANPFGYLSPTRAQHVRDSLGAGAPWIVDGGACALGLESTVVDVSVPGRPARILRPGPVTAEFLAEVLGSPVSLVHPLGEGRDKVPPSGEGLVAPGMLERHYSPRTPLGLLEPGARPPGAAAGTRAAWVRLRREAGSTAPAGVEVYWLSERGDLTEAARGLYELLRRLDAAGYAQLWCEQAPEGGLGAAFNDRLRRGAAKRESTC